MIFKKIGLGVLLPIGIWVLALGMLGLVKPPTVTPNKEAAKTIPLVESAAVTQFTESFVIESDGVVVPFREIQLAAQVSGRIAYKSEHCRAGQEV